MRRGIVLLAVLMLGPAATSCSRAINESQAMSRAQQLTRQLANSVTPHATFVQGAAPRQQSGGCGPERPDLVSVSYSLDLPVLPQSRYKELFAASQRWLRSQHYQVSLVGRSPPMSVDGVTPDGFTVSYNIAIGGTSWYETGSPCVSKS